MHTSVFAPRKEGSDAFPVVTACADAVACSKRGSGWVTAKRECVGAAVKLQMWQQEQRASFLTVLITPYANEHITALT